SLIVEKIAPFDPENLPEDIVGLASWQGGSAPAAEIYVPAGTAVAVLQNVNKTLRASPGKVAVTLLLPNGGDLRKMRLPFSIDPSPALINVIENILGAGSFKRF
ncbi:hypothetical protein KKE03_03695, partial [Patescibacteria group bacterium]|nr:hypothetical protein [Patescibacteria group bacterium]